MSGSIESTFGALSAEGRGFVLGATVLGEDGSLGAFLMPPQAEPCTAALRALFTLPREAKAIFIGQLARELGAAYPANLDQVHPSWLHKVLGPEPSDLVAALVAGAPPSARQAAADLLEAREREGLPVETATLLPEIAAEMRRLVFAGLAAPAAAAKPEIAELLHQTGEALLGEIRRLGARALGASLVNAPVDVKARALAGVGVALAEDLREAMRAADSFMRADAEADVKAAVADGAGGAKERLELIGVSALDRKLRGEGAEVRWALAVRLPERVGARLLCGGAA